MKLTILVPEVASCAVTRCTYNVSRGCHARAITVGHETHPQCDTYYVAKAHASAGTKAGVGACRATACQHNQDFECQADAISVDVHDGHADCVTFQI